MNMITTAPVTIDAPAAIADEERYEVVNGQRVELPPMSAFEVRIATVLSVLLETFAHPRKLGRVATEMLFLIDSSLGLQRKPDVAFVSYERWARTLRVPRTNAWAVVPDLAVEVVSATNLAEDLVQRVLEFFRAGCREVWLVYPTLQQIYVYQSPTSIRVFLPGEEVHDSIVLPGLRLPLAVVFEEETAAGS